MSNTAFRVVRGTDDKISIMPNIDGSVYFATDSKKIYLDNAGTRMSMGGNTGVYYATADFEGMEGPEFFFTFDDIEGDNIPNPDDLIINSDGSFYRVLEKVDDEIKTSRLTIAGTGDGNTENIYGTISMQIEGSVNRTVLLDQELFINTIFSACDIDNENTGKGRYEVLVDKVIRKKGEIPNSYGEQDPIVVPIEIGSIFTQPGKYTVKIVCYGYTGGVNEVSVSKSLTVEVTDFTLTWNYNSTKINSVDSDFNINWNINVEGEDVRTTIMIDDTHKIESNLMSLTLTPQELESYGLTHGAHKIQIQASAVIGSDAERKFSNLIIKNVIFYNSQRADYIVACDFFETKVNQYTTIQIPIMIYHSDNINGTAEINFTVNGTPKQPLQNCKNLTTYYFAYTPDTAGFIPLQFSCGGGRANLVLNVESLNLNISEVPGYEFKFKATDFSNNEEIQTWKINNTPLEFSSNFDWINGGLKSGIDDVGPYFKITAGTSVTFPYKLFATDLKESGACFKMIFKAHNCRDYDAIVANAASADGRGVIFRAQNASIRSLSKELTVRYCEDTYIEYEFDVCQYSDGDITSQYLTTWLDGIPASVTDLSGNDSFMQLNPVSNLVIGSDDCDVYIYLIKFYKKHLTSSEHLNNFIIDAPNSTEMISRFNRNDILKTDRNGNKYIHPETLAIKNPDCNVFIYDVPSIPTSKKDVVDDKNNDKCCKFTHLKGSSEALRHYEGVKLRAQGTSSMNLGIAAFNLDATLPEAISITDEAIPVKYLNTKVNVASCEGANNALNQEWYNRYQPYYNQKRLQVRTDGKIARDTMQFINGVVFMQDNNKIINDAIPTKNNVFKEISGYVQSPYPRMYAIGNMGNAKKNIEVFHGAGNKYECCIENADNNTSTQRMLFVGGCIFPPAGSNDDEKARDIALNLPDSLFDENGFVIPGEDWGTTYDEVTNTYFSNKELWKNTLIKEGFFEFRYCKDEEDFVPDEEFATFDDYQWELSNRFLRLVRWFATNNPYNATGQEFAEPVVFEDYTIKGVKATAYSNYPKEREILSGTVVAGGTYTHDSAEYRVAKMLRESENYLILDSLVYHYLFIERHTLADNVAKNTFWNTEDGIHWELTKDYDNDTADGVNNDGELVFDYGIEIMDNTATGTAVFNARPSAWLHFIDGLLPLREKMYQSLQNAWRADTYLEAFESWQKVIPEICWIEHFDRLYFRPRNVYGNGDYLKRLAGGKKTHQRKQYETYQEQYMNSEYKTNTEEGTSISWRSHQPTNRPDIADENGDYTISAKLKLYADGYFSAAFASGAGTADAINMHERGKKGEIITFSKTSKSPFDDATCYIYSPNLYQEFTETEGLYPSTITASAAHKLRKLTYMPKNEVQKTMINSTLSLGSNIEELILQNCQAPTGTEKVDLNLNNNTRLKTLDTTGSNLFTGYTIADGAPITTLKIEKPTTLTLQNLRYLVPDNFVINDYSRLSKIEINNIDYNGINSKDIVKNTIMNREIGIEYDLQNVNWVFDADDNITSNIPLLDKLKDSVPAANKTRALGLTGVATVPNDAYSEDNPLGLYEKYGLISSDDSTYPNLILNFLDENQQQKLYTINIEDGDGKIVWSRQVSNFNNLTNELLNNGALGAFNVQNAIRKSSSNEFIYSFNASWTYTTASGITGTINSGSEEYQYLDLTVLNSIDEEDITIKPDYASIIRYYTINFYNQGQLFTTRQATYGTSFADIKPDIIPVKDDSALALTKTYQLIGYGAIDGENTTIAENSWAVTVDTNLYAVFAETDVYKIDYSDCLDISGTTVKGLKTNSDNEFVYQGQKITIPANITAIAANAFNSYDQSGKNGKLNYIFIAPNSQLQEIGAQAFKSPAIKYFDFANATKLVLIDQAAFQYSHILSSSLYKNATINLPISLAHIGAYGFNQCKGEGVIITLMVPASVNQMGSYAISNWSEVQDAMVQIGKPNDLSKLSFDWNTNNDPVITSNYQPGQLSSTDIKTVYFYTNRYTSEELIDTYIKNVDLSCMIE